MPNDETVILTVEGADNQFRVEPQSRTITGIVVPWDAVAMSGGKSWRFQRGSLQWGPRESRVKLNLNHDHDKPIGVARSLINRQDGLEASFKIATGAEGDRMLALAQDEILDGFSIEVNFQQDSYAPDPNDKKINNVQSARLTGVALTHEPAFDGARVESIAAKEERVKMPEVKEEQDTSAQFREAIEAGFTRLIEVQETQIDKLGESIGKNILAAAEDFSNSGDDRHVPRAAPRIRLTNDPPVYQYGRLGVSGDSIVRDAYYSKFHNDDAARDRLKRHTAQQDAMRTAMFAASADAQFTQVTTSNASQVIPPGYRPDLYVAHLIQGRPFVDNVSRGTIDNASPFTVPVFATATATVGAHTEGTNPTDGAITFATKTVTPQAFSGIMNLSREVVDSANPAIDSIVMAFMREEYARDTEARAYTEFNSATLGLGGTITTGFVPSGAQAATTSGQGDELIAGIRTALSLYKFRRFGPATRGVLSQEATTALATAVDTTGRHLLPYQGSVNTVGQSNAAQGVYNIDGIDFEPAWSITGNAAGDFDVAFWNINDVWAWESPLLQFRYEEKLGPATIQLALFGYFAVHILRPIGLSGIRHTAA